MAKRPDKQDISNAVYRMSSVYGETTKNKELRYAIHEKITELNFNIYILDNELYTKYRNELV